MVASFFPASRNNERVAVLTALANMLFIADGRLTDVEKFGTSTARTRNLFLGKKLGRFLTDFHVATLCLVTEGEIECYVVWIRNGETKCGEVMLYGSASHIGTHDIRCDVRDVREVELGTFGHISRNFDVSIADNADKERETVGILRDVESISLEALNGSVSRNMEKLSENFIEPTLVHGVERVRGCVLRSFSLRSGGLHRCG